MSAEQGKILLGKPAVASIKEKLSRRDPKKVIKEIQEENGLNVPSCIHAFPLLDLHHFPRSDIYLSVLTHLRTKLLEKVETSSPETINQLLKETFPYVKIKELRDVTMAVLKRHKDIPPKYLDVLATDAELFAECPMDVKRQVWVHSQRLFLEMTRKIMLEAVEQLHASWGTQDIGALIARAKARRSTPQINELIRVLGTSLKLYNFVLKALRRRFMETGDYNWCTLRADVLMALHDGEVHDIYRKDPCHHFTWCLSAGIRDQNMDAKRSSELDTAATRALSEDPTALGDFAMIVRDPYTTHTLVRAAYKLVKEIITQQALPTTHATLSQIIRVLCLGNKVMLVLQGSVTLAEISELHPRVMTEFLPLLAKMIVEDEIVVLDEKATSRELPEEFADFLSNVYLTRELCAVYAMERAMASDMLRLTQVLPLLVAEDSCVESLQLFVRRLTAQILGPSWEEFAVSGICDVLIEEFFIPLSRAFVQVHLLVAELFSKLPGPLPDSVIGPSLVALATTGAVPSSKEDPAWEPLISTHRYIVSHTILEAEHRQAILPKIDEWSAMVHPSDVVMADVEGSHVDMSV